MKNQRTTHLSTLLTQVLLLTAAALAACGSDPADPADADTGGRGEIGISVSTVSTGTASTGAATRAATLCDAATLRREAAYRVSGNSYFRLLAYREGQTTPCIDSYCMYFEDRWRFCDHDGTLQHYYWPVGGPVEAAGGTEGLNFMAYHPTDAAGTAPLAATCMTIGTYADRRPSLAVTSLPLTNEGQATLRELVCAYAPGTTRLTRGGDVPLRFHHPLAAVYITLSAAYPDEELLSISFTNVKNNATGLVGTEQTTWTPTGTAGTLALTYDSDDAASPRYKKVMNQTMYPGVIEGPLLVLPQPLGGSSISVTYRKSGAAAQTFTKSFAATDAWESGKRYYYDLYFGYDKTAEIMIRTTVEPWDDKGNGSQWQAD